jgi:hypothetical protein
MENYIIPTYIICKKFSNNEQTLTKLAIMVINSLNIVTHNYPFITHQAKDQHFNKWRNFLYTGI